MRSYAWVLAALTFGSVARADDVGTDVERFEETPAVRRSGFTLGLTGGLALGSAAGYPNEVEKIDQPEFRASTGLGVSSGGGLHIGGALADWLNIGIGLSGGGFRARGLEASGGSVHVRVEAFPLFYSGGWLQDLGVAGTAGTGGYVVERDGATAAEGEGTSAVGLGLFHESVRFWRIAMGPSLEYSHHFSRSIASHFLVVGWRSAFYGGP